MGDGEKRLGSTSDDGCWVGKGLVKVESSQRCTNRDEEGVEGGRWVEG